MVEKKQIIIIILLVAIIALAGLIAYTLLNQTQYQTIQISNGTTIEVPIADDMRWTEEGYGIKMYACQSKQVSLTCYNSQETPNLIGAGAFAIARELLLNGSTDVENYNGYQIKENTVNNTHYYIVSAGNDTTHDNIIIGSGDLGILKHMLDTLKFGEPGKATQANATNAQTANVNTPNSATNTSKSNPNDNDELMYGGYSKEEYYYKMGLAEGHLQANGYNSWEDMENDVNYYSGGSGSEPTPSPNP